MNDHLISVIMPCYNDQEYLRESVASALTQSYRNIEVIVVDDGSSDGSPELLKLLQGGDSRLKVFSQANRGAGPARNRGLAEARGELVAFLDADDYWSADCLEKLHGALCLSRADIAYCGWQNTGLPEARCQPYLPADFSRVDRAEAFLGGCPWPIHAALTRRQAISQAGGFDEGLSSCMDYDLWLRLAPATQTVLVPEVLAYYRHHGGTQITKNRARVALNHWRVQKNFLRLHPEVAARLGKRRVRELTCGELLKRGYICYWGRDMHSARAIFRTILLAGYGTLKDLKYLLPALLPLAWHSKLIELFERDGKPC